MFCTIWSLKFSFFALELFFLSFFLFLFILVVCPPVLEHYYALSLFLRLSSLFLFVIGFLLLCLLVLLLPLISSFSLSSWHHLCPSTMSLCRLSASLSVPLCSSVIVTITVHWQPLFGRHPPLFGHHAPLFGCDSATVRLPSTVVRPPCASVRPLFGRCWANLHRHSGKT